MTSSYDPIRMRQGTVVYCAHDAGRRVSLFVAVTNKQESQKLVVTPRPPPTLPAKSEAAGRHTNLC